MEDGILNGKRILAVDDEPDILAVLADQYEYLPAWKHLMRKVKSFCESIFQSCWEEKTDLRWIEFWDILPIEPASKKTIAA